MLQPRKPENEIKLAGLLHCKTKSRPAGSDEATAFRITALCAMQIKQTSMIGFCLIELIFN